MNQIVNTLGAMYVGAMVTMVLYGITTLQTYFYFIHFPQDGRGLKLLVTLVWVLDTVHVSFVGHAMFHYLVSSFGDPSQFVDGIWSLYASMADNLIMAIVVQCFFTKRIYHLCSPRLKWPVTSVIFFVVIAHFAFGLETIVEFFAIRRLDKLQEVTFIAVLPFGITAVLSDIFIALALCILLAGSRSDYQDTNALVNNLIIFAINRCLLTVAVAISEVIVFVCIPNSFYTLAIDFVIGKLYTNSLLASLNSRRALKPKAQLGEVDLSGTELSSSFRVAPRPRSRFGTQRGRMEQTTIDLDALQMGSLTSSDDRAGLTDFEKDRVLPHRPPKASLRRPFTADPTVTV